MKNIFTILVFFLSISTSNAQWAQMGADIYGESENDQAGRSVCMNSDGSIIAIGSPYNTDNGVDSGKVRVYKYASGNWSQMGADIEGDPIWDLSGWSVSLSTDGLTLAIGAPEAYDEDLYYAGQVKIFQFVSGDWLQIGDPIIGETTTDDRTGYAISLSADGSIIAIASLGIYQYTGRVRVFENQGNEWVQIGNSMDGINTSKDFGHSLDINNDGTTLVIGAPNHSNGDDIGYVKVFTNNAGTWEQVGDTLYADESGDRFGWAVSINASGNRIAVTAFYHGDFDGITRVFQNNSGVWEQVGADIYDEINDYMFGYDVCFNEEGNRLVISSKRTYVRRGHVCLYQENAGQWEEVGDYIIGDEVDDYSGTSIFLNDIGDTVVIGAPFNDTNGNKAGQVKVFKYTDSSSTNDLWMDAISIYPNPCKESFTIDFSNENVKKISITDSLGKIVKIISNPTVITRVTLSEFSKGIYLVKMETEKGVIAKKIIKE